MEYAINMNGSAANVKIMGKLTFIDHEKFRNIINQVSEGLIKNLSVDLSQLEFIDSAGLGLMLLLRDAASQTSANLSLFNASGQVKKVFEVSRFDTLFNMK